MLKVFSYFLLFTIYLHAFTSEELIKKIEDNLTGETASMNITMVVHTKKSKRTMKMSSLSIGKEKSFIKINYPKKDKGITFLKIDHVMWQYVPRIERVIKIPASMMLQSWMGSDFSNDDLAKESSISKDYDAKIIDENSLIYNLELIPKEESAVVWGKLEMEVSKQYFLPLSVKYFNEDNILIRVLNYKKIEKFNDRFYPTYWEMLPQTEDKKNNKTIVTIDNAQFDIDIDDSYFTKNALKRYSK